MTDEEKEKLKYVEQLMAVHLEYDDKDFYEFRDSLNTFTGILRRKYGKQATNDCALFHYLIGSSAYFDPLPRFDFDGEDSIILFLERATSGE